MIRKTLVRWSHDLRRKATGSLQTMTVTGTTNVPSAAARRKITMDHRLTSISVLTAVIRWKFESRKTQVWKMPENRAKRNIRTHKVVITPSLVANLNIKSKFD